VGAAQGNDGAAAFAQEGKADRPV